MSKIWGLKQTRSSYDPKCVFSDNMRQNSGNKVIKSSKSCERPELFNFYFCVFPHCYYQSLISKRETKAMFALKLKIFQTFSYFLIS